MDTASKDRQCDQLQLWRPAIINHLYWTAASTPDGNPAVMEAKWRSLVNHIQDIHDHDTPAFSSCAHAPLEGDQRHKEWLEPGTVHSIWHYACSTEFPLEKKILFVCLRACLTILVSCRLNGSRKAGGYNYKDILTQGCSTVVSAAPDLLP